MKTRGGSHRLRTSLLLLLLSAGLAVTWAYLYLQTSVQSLRGNAQLSGLEDAVAVYSDEFEIPHVFASSEADLFRAQGYLHASERLWQMQLLRRTAQGRLSELFGPRALPVDQLVRTLDLWGAADRSLAALPDSVRSLLEAYADGVNAKLTSWTGSWPPEFFLLRFRPEPWDAQASVAIGKVMALDLSHWRRELSRLRASVVLDPERFEYLQLPYPVWGPTILPKSPATGRRGVPSVASVEADPDRLPSGQPRESGWDPFRFLGRFSLRASNSWAVMGERSKSGFPLLANDMHLALKAPATWYLVALHAERSGLHVAGLSLPGVPGVVVGYNREVAWGFTNGMVDDMDFVVEAVNLDRSAYRLEDSWEPFAARRETIHVRGRDEPVVQLVRETIRGPILSDVLPDMGITLSALWTGRYPTTAADGLLRMNRAASAAEFDRAVRRFLSPHQNVIYVTAHGDLGYRLSGSVPQREGWNGTVPVTFEVAGSGWRGFRPPDSMPSAMNPEVGYFASANNLQAVEEFGLLGSDYPVPFRARRIVDRLEADVKWTREKMRDLQLDTWSGLAERTVHRAVAAARRIGADSAAAQLASWDLRATVDSREATLFYLWLYRLRSLLAADEFEGMERWTLFPDRALLQILEEGNSPWVDDIRTDTLERLSALEETAMSHTLRAARGRNWGQVHREQSVHLLGSVVWLDRLFRFNVGPYPGPGGPHTVRPGEAMSWGSLDSASWRPPLTVEYGPSERFVAEMKPARSVGYFLLPTGQSGNPLSPNYRDMAPRWSQGELIYVPIYEAEARLRAAQSLQLLPP